jgi:hypothetical protein
VHYCSFASGNGEDEETSCEDAEGKESERGDDVNRNTDAIVGGPYGELRLGSFDCIVDGKAVAAWVVYMEDDQSLLHRVFVGFVEAFEFARRCVGAT